MLVLLLPRAHKRVKVQYHYNISQTDSKDQYPIIQVSKMDITRCRLVRPIFQKEKTLAHDLVSDASGGLAQDTLLKLWHFALVSFFANSQ